MIKLNCPSCGGHLDLPANLKVAHCMYCGTKILLQDTEIPNEKVSAKRFLELCMTAIEVNNYVEAVQFSNKALEIDPGNVEAWICKATGTFWLTTEAENKYDEAMSYLKIAAKLSPGDERIYKARVDLTKNQAWWYHNLANISFNKALTEWKRNKENLKDAQLYSGGYFLDAMEKTILASHYSPSDLSILENVNTIRKNVNWISWDDEVEDRIRILEQITAKNFAEETLPGIIVELANTRRELKQLYSSRKGFLDSVKIKAAEAKEKSLIRRIERLQQQAAYILPEFQYDWEG